MSKFLPLFIVKRLEIGEEISMSINTAGNDVRNIPNKTDTTHHN